MVTASHVVALCRECSQMNGAVRKIHLGEVLRWTADNEACGEVVVRDMATGEDLELEGELALPYLWKNNHL